MKTEIMKRSKKFFGQVSRIGVCAVAFFSVMMYLPAEASEECPNPTPNVEATQTATPTPGPKNWSAGSGIGTVLDEHGEPAEDEEGNPIVDGRMTAPQNQTVDPYDPEKVVVMPGERVGAAVESATDMDHWTRADNDGIDCNNDDYGDDLGDSGDSVTYQWTATGGRFDGATDGTGATWIAPVTSGVYTISCTIDDTPTAVSAPETGSRDDGAITRSCTVVVASVSLQSDEESGTKVAAGALSSPEHQADFKIKVTDDEGNPLSGKSVRTPEVVSGGLGPYEDVTATVELTQSTTDSEGIAWGRFTSGNRTENTTIKLRLDPDDAESDGPELTFEQTWNELSDEEAWEYEPYFEYDEPSTITFYMEYSRNGTWTPITGHDLDFVTTAIAGYEWNPDIGEDWDEDGFADGDYEYVTYSDEDSDSSGFDQWNGLVEWSGVTDNGGAYDVDQTIWWHDDFIADAVYFDVEDSTAYDASGATEE